MSKTEQYLKEAFAGESQANRRYLAFAAKADQEGYPQVARLFRAAAEAETIHAHSHLRALNGIRSTKENLLEAVAGDCTLMTISIGGGIGQSRTMMLLLRKAHLGEVTVSVWPQILKEICAQKNIHVLE